MGWPGRLQLRYHFDGTRTVCHDRHEGPLRVLSRLYPEGPGVCHHVLVHPPGGIVGGDSLDIGVDLQPGAHALITTPGATRFYRSVGEPAAQSLHATLAAGARFEWLPLETLVYSAALARNRLRFELAPGAEMIGWDVLALGLPASGQPYREGRFEQEIELPGVWLERGRLDAVDTRLLDGPLGWAGHRVMASLWFAAGEPLADDRRAALLETARDTAAGDPLSATTGATSPHERVVLVRALAPRVEPAMQLLARIWSRWRRLAWALEASAPRVWRT